MATNMPGPVNLGELNACIVRAARLTATCSAAGGTSSGMVTAALVTLTATPVIAAGKVFSQVNACGTTMFTLTQEDKVTGYTLAGEFAWSDFEMMALLFGGSTILGKAAGTFAGKVIGYADPIYNGPSRNGAYLEVITTSVVEGSGDCIQTGVTAPVAFGHIFPKCKLIGGAMTFQNDIKRIAFTGASTNSPSLFDGPWNDFPGAGYTPNSAHIVVGYDQATYNAILASVVVGAADLPVGS